MKILYPIQNYNDHKPKSFFNRYLGHARNQIKAASTIAIMLAMPTVANAATQVFEAAGATAGDIQVAVDSYRASLGTLNPNVAGSRPDGRREINWDGVPDQFSAPNTMPGNFFNANSPRGVVFFTPGTGFQNSAKLGNPTNTPIEFGNLKRDFAKQFSTFSPERLFTALNSNIMEVLFFEPGSTKQATVKGFGAVFTDVDNRNTTKIEYFDIKGNLLHSQSVLPGGVKKQSLSFLGVTFDTASVYLVRITSGDNFARDKFVKRSRTDAVVMDDFIYGEPQPILQPE